MKSNAVGQLILPEINSPLAHYSNKTISSKTFPSAWKFSKIVPVWKVKDPISIIQGFGKDHSVMAF
jgi:hypothetical protein